MSETGTYAVDSIELPSGSVAVGLDGSPSSELALAWAADEARLAGLPLTLVHAVTPYGPERLEPAGTGRPLDPGSGATVSDRVLSRARASIADLAPGTEVHELLQTMDPRDLLVRVSEHASTLVIGSRGLGPVRSLVLGSVGAAVTRHARCPVVVQRVHWPDAVRGGVLVGVDGTDRSTAPLAYAFTQAARRGLPLTVLHSVHDVLSAPDPFVLDRMVQGVEEHRGFVAETVARMRQQHPRVPAHTVLARKQPADALVEVGEQMDLLVVGAHHGGVVSRMLLGSTAASVVENAPCPVAVVPEP